MNVINEVKRKIPFKHLSVGNTFIVEDKHYLYMKTLPSVLENNHNINTIVLNDGSVTCFDEEKEVIVVECEVKIIREGW